jgi:hypothetical protein
MKNKDRDGKQRRTKASAAAKPVRKAAQPLRSGVEMRVAKPDRAHVADPGGYRVTEAASLTGSGRPEEVGRVVAVEDGFQAWDRVDEGYALVGVFPSSADAIFAVGGGKRPTRRTALAERQGKLLPFKPKKK